nr:hypothetical protein BaRGS_004245 [Batillaria attramentaria]
MADIKLVYFPVRARAEPLRMAFELSGKKYENVIIPSEKWAEEKANAPYGQLPYLVVKGKKYGESLALAGYVARECGLAGKTSEDAMRVTEVCSLIADLMTNMGKTQFETDEAKKAELQKQLVTETIPRFMGYFEKLLKENGSSGFFIGSALTLADLAAYDIVESLLKINADVLSAFPEVKKMRGKVEENPKMKAYLAKRPQTEF